MRVVAYLGFGSNLGDRLENIAGAVRALAASTRRDSIGGEALTIVAVSGVYESDPLAADGAVLPGHPPFLNAAIRVETRLKPLELLWLAAGVEGAFGRARTDEVTPRVIDIDVLLYGPERLYHRDLTVPHPRLQNRAFVLKPLYDLDQGLVIPGNGAVRALLDAVGSQRCVQLHSADAFRDQIVR